MDRDLLVHLPVVLAVARRRGFAAAAAELGMSPSAVSHAVRQVEDRLGVPLFARTTRSVALTDAGRALVDGAGPALAEIAERFELLRGVAGRPAGVVRVSAGSVAVPLALAPLMAELQRRQPEVRVEVVVDNALADIVAEACDAGVRLGEMIAADMVAVRLTPPFRTAVVATPAYLARAGRPVTVDDLAGHTCIGHRLAGTGALYRWELQARGREVAVAVGGGPVVNDVLAARELALAGLGLAYLFEPLVRADLDAGGLEEVLVETAIEEPGFFLYFPRRAAMAPKLRALVDTARVTVERISADAP
ncbi:MAG: LysR family transcriptional regulator [Alphaproteobacteria bacterium]|jgi:DNA-binding transcriptional LysR family regulator|nr:LysR family transcriptional regulator [Alphaproteobacteria bacterium]